MRSPEAIERSLEGCPATSDAPAAARALLSAAEEVLEAWIAARGAEPTVEQREGFRLLALHRQGAQDTPSFNACRETCREIAYHYNIVTLAPPDGGSAKRLEMMAMLVRHLALFVGGKMQVEKLGDFCCASRTLRLESAARDGETPGDRNA